MTADRYAEFEDWAEGQTPVPSAGAVSAQFDVSLSTAYRWLQRRDGETMRGRRQYEQGELTDAVLAALASLDRPCKRHDLVAATGGTDSAVAWALSGLYMSGRIQRHRDDRSWLYESLRDPTPTLDLMPPPREIVPLLPHLGVRCTVDSPWRSAA